LEICFGLSTDWVTTTVEARGCFPPCREFDLALSLAKMLIAFSTLSRAFCLRYIIYEADSGPLRKETFFLEKLGHPFLD